MRHAECYGLQLLEDIGNYACIIEKEGNNDAQQAATLKRLIAAARSALTDLTRVDDDTGELFCPIVFLSSCIVCHRSWVCSTSLWSCAKNDLAGMPEE